MVLDLSSPHEFRPILLSRRGEITAWLLALVTLIVLMVVQVRLTHVPAASFLIFVFFTLSGASISLGNWMDRKTHLRLDERGVSFSNGVRNVHFDWGEIQEVRVLPHPLGDKVHVMGKGARFQFRTLGEVRLKGEVKGRMGFAEGQAILQTILQRSGLHPLEPEEDRVGRYYGRG